MWSKRKAAAMFSVGAALLLTTPAWTQGACLAALVAVGVWVAILLEKVPVPNLRGQSWYMAAGSIGALCFGFNFYNSWVDSSPADVLSDLLGCTPEALTQTVAVILVLGAAPAFAQVMGTYCRWAMEDIREKAREIPPKKGEIPMAKAFFLLFALYVVGISAILRTNFYYKDDISRAIFGYKQWDYFGRFLSTALATFVHTGDFLCDIAPLPQLLAMGVMALSGVLILYLVYGRTSFTLWELVAMVPLGLNPYFLECVSFRFDAVYMAVSVLGGILPLLYRKRGAKGYLFGGMLGILMVCTTYQASTGVFPMLVILLALQDWNRGQRPREAMGFCLKSLGGYGLGLVYYKAILMRPTNAGYVTSTLPGLDSLLSSTLRHLRHYFSNVLSDFRAWWLVMILLLALGFLWVMAHGSKRPKWVSALVSLAALVAMGVLCFGIYPMLSSPLYAPRGMYGFGIWVALLCVVCAGLRENVAVKLPALALAWGFFVFSFTYGNALDLQKEYTEFRLQLVIQDLNELDILETEEEKTVWISGSIGKTPLLSYTPQDGKILNRLVPDTFSGGDDLTQFRFFYYYDLPGLTMAQWDEKAPEDLPVLKDTHFHTIYGEGDNMVIELK